MITSGHPRFNDSDLAAIQSASGDLAAWKEAFRRFGVDAPTRVAGDFAVALRVDDRRFFLAVDRFAVRTLCFRVDSERLQVAERADAAASVSASLDPQALFSYLYFHAIPAPQTVFKDVFRVPAGHFAMLDNGRLRVAPWWVPRFVENQNVPIEELKRRFLSLVRRGVERQIGTGTAGCFLSGGTDSSTVAGMVTSVTGLPAQTFSIGFDAKGYDEMEYARIAARHFKTDHHEYYVTPDDLIAGIPAVATSFDQPFGNSSVVPAYYCAKVAREAGLDLILGGDGGDELFGGNTRYAKQRVFGIYQHLPHFLRKGLGGSRILHSKAAGRTSIGRKAASYLEQAQVPMPDRLQMYNLIFRLGLKEVLTPEFLMNVDTEEPLRQQREVYAASNAGALINKMLFFDWRYTLADNDLPKVVGATRLAGIPVGFPFLDDELVDFSLVLAPELKLKGLQLRWFFKEALRGFLPDQILAKKKHGFGLPFGVWVNTHGALKSMAFDRIRSLGQRGIVRTDFIGRLISEYLPAHPGYYGEMVWILMMLEQWMESCPARPRATIE